MSIVDLKVVPVPLLPVTNIEQYVSETMIINKKRQWEKINNIWKKNTPGRIWTEL